METEVEEEVATKRIKTDTSDNDDISEKAAEQAAPSEDYETFLQEFLKKRRQDNTPLFQKVIRQEEAEAKNRDPAEDLKLYRNACADFSDCVMEITEIKATKPEGWKEKINELRKEASFITVIMKKLNRVEKTRTKISREKVNKERHLVDIAQLKLDNLLCEMQHLRKEVDKCLKFKSRPLGIDLVPVQEFYDKSPASVSKPEITKADEHQLQLARLEWELTQRKELATLLNDLEAKKTHVTGQIEKKERDLNGLAPLIKEVLIVTKPLQDKLGVAPPKTVSVNEFASLLPEPLYFLYVQAVAYGDACDKTLVVDIKGNISDAKRVKRQQFQQDSKISSDEESEVDEDSLKEEKKQKKLELKQQKLHTKHPLSVLLRITIKDGSKLDLQFYYFLHLHLLTVMPTLNVNSFTSSSTHGLFTHFCLLSNLFQGDTGMQSPNLKNYYQFKEVGLESFNHEKYGTPYIWVQRMGGLNFIGLDDKVEARQDISKANMPIIIKELKRRIQNRITLLPIISDFERGEVFAPKNMRAVKLNCALKTWKGSNWAEITENPALNHLKETSFISPNDIFFKGLITRADEKLNVYTALKCDYPTSPPFIFMEMEYDGETWTSKNNSRIQEMEREVNFHWKELLTTKAEAPKSLSFQIFKVMVCFDLLLESLDTEEYPSNKKFLQLYRGRNRHLPYKFVPEESLFVHRN